jgi:hypothetical protein
MSTAFETAVHDLVEVFQEFLDLGEPYEMSDEVKKKLMSAVGVAAINLAIEVVNGPTRIANAIGDVAGALDRIDGTLKRMTIPLSLDNEGNILPPMPSPTEEYLRRATVALENIVEEQFHKIR